MVLYIVATPIGNLKDISLRALEILKEVDLILCEDTRTTKKLLNHYNITTPTLSYHQHSELKKTEGIIDLLKGGKNLALVSEAGTPSVSDPGSQLVREVVKSLGSQAKILPVPGPSAVLAAGSISGFDMDKFLFLGFPPAKKKRQKFFQEALSSKHPVIFYESPYKIIKTLKELSFLGASFRKAVVCRELTKKFETVCRGRIEEIIKELEKGVLKGEFVVVLEAKE